MRRIAVLFRMTALTVGLVLTMSAASGMGQTTGSTAELNAANDKADKYIWLEDVSGEKAMSWVNAENVKSAAVLEADPRFKTLEAEALKVLESPARLANPSFRVGTIYNTWQDAQHVRGILRKTSLSSYLTDDPKWETVLDYDALAKADNQRWVQMGLVCLYPGDDLCLVALSAGGEDAVTYREFSLKAGTFVEGGFVLPKSKQDVTWIDKDTLLIARDWGAGTMTKSGYPFVVKRLKRGQAVEQAKEVFRGTEDDVRVGATTIHDEQGHSVTVIERGLDFFHNETHLYTAQGAVVKLALPAKSALNDLLDGQMVVTLDEAWTPAADGKTFPAGSLVAIDLAAANQDAAHLKPVTIFEPTATEFAQQVGGTRNHLLLTTLENVQGRAYVYTHAGAGWTRKKLDVPDNVAVGIITGNSSDDRFFLDLTGFLTPSSLLLGDAATATMKTVKTLPAQFDASGMTVEQLSATSKDGTKVPYFVVHKTAIKYDGSNPTLLTAYGGFQISRTPSYSAVTGKLWLEHGGVFVLANIRGGGEFGPAWHEAGLKTKRQRIYDDFYSVAQDLVTRKITSTAKLGIVGGSNGGLLMGVEMTQHPTEYKAIVIQVPLLDMLRFEHIAAGASWVGEYGSVTIPEERAFLAGISPYNQLKPHVTYPEPLIFTTTKDDRVGPVHARKFAAKMKEYGKPYFYQEITEGGHGSGADLKETAKTNATEFVYLARKLMGTPGQ